MGVIALIAVGAAFAAAAVVLIAFTVLSRDRDKMRDTWIVYALEFVTMGVILVPAYVGGIVFSAVVGILASFCLLEFLGIQKEAVPAAMKVVTVALGLATFALAHFYSFPTLYLSIPVAAATLLVASLFFPNEQRYLHSTALCVMGLVYVPVFLSHLVLIRKLNNGFLIILFMYGISEIHDSFAYLFGRMLGRKKIFPNISPNKTWAGSIGGIVAAVTTGLIVNLTVTRFSLAFAATVVPTIIIFTILGDLVGSKIKRALGVKDFGSLVPRTGGVLDAYDNLLLIAPCVYCLSLLVAR